MQFDGINWIRQETASGGILMRPLSQSKHNSLTAVLDQGFGLKCCYDQPYVIPAKTVTFLVAQPRFKQLLLNRFSQQQHRLQLGETTLLFTGDDALGVDAVNLPVLYGHQPSRFNSGDYFKVFSNFSSISFEFPFDLAYLMILSWFFRFIFL